jgi:hypothetical protein
VCSSDLEKFGRTRGELALSVNVNVDFPEDPDGFVALQATEFPEYDNDQIVYGPTPEAAVTGLRRFVDAGVTHFQVSPADLRTLRLFAREVAPASAR